MRFAWIGRRPKDYSTTGLASYPREAWDNFVSMTVVVIDDNDLVVEYIPCDIDEPLGWPLETAIKKFKTVVETWRKFNADRRNSGLPGLRDKAGEHS